MYVDDNKERSYGIVNAVTETSRGLCVGVAPAPFENEKNDDKVIIKEGNRPGQKLKFLLFLEGHFVFTFVVGCIV